jgi:cob(I)alamin adenosyltransferase
MKIYTRTGDTGKTSLFDNTRVWKSSRRVDTYGTIDELNSVLGMAAAELSGSIPYKKKLVKLIEQIQRDLFVLGSCLATPGSHVLDFDVKERVVYFEQQIDEMTDQLPQLANFILPGGGRASATLHIARSISRRAERNLVALILEEEVDPLIIAYVNRLSDLLFTMSRYANHKEHKKETTWKR